MNPTVGLLLPLMLGQPAGLGCLPCGPTASRPPMLAYLPHPPYFKQVCPPDGPPAPVLAVRAVLADGVKINPIPADAKSAAFPSGTTFGFRPGYRYWLRFDDLPERNGESLFAVLEVRGSLVPRPGMKYMEYPAALTLTQADMDKAFRGRMVTKVIYLEDPSRALALEATPNKPIEVASDTVERAVEEAEANGRLVAILRFGDRTPSDEELVRLSVAGTVLTPGTVLGPPAAPPAFGVSPIPLFDPILGPKTLDGECFINGGAGEDTGIGFNGSVQPIRTTNTVAEYLSGSKRKFSVSNTVCICAPRFVIRTADVGSSGYQGALAAAQLQQILRRNVFQQREFAQSLYGRDRLRALDARIRPSQSVVTVGLHAFAATTKPQGLGKLEGVAVAFVVTEVEEISNFPGQLVLTKTVDPFGAVKQGDVLTVTLKYQNNTRQPVTDLILTDSLSGRLEYQAGTAAADRPSNVTLSDNEAGGQVVRFEIPGPIPPAGSGVVVFKVKVR